MNEWDHWYGHVPMTTYQDQINELREEVGRLRREIATIQIQNGAKPAATLSAENASAYERLEKWAKERATADGVPTYVVLKKQDIVEIVEAAPKTLEELSKVKGMGPKKIELYGSAILFALNGEGW